ncbi:MAG: hypothetical protein ACLU3I_00465 [Acutalibacteraceae bacterium]
MLYCFCAFVFLFYSSFSQLAEAFFPAGLGWLYFAMFAIMAFALMFIGSSLYGEIPAVRGEGQRAAAVACRSGPV